MTRYNHLVGIAFEVISDDEEGYDFTANMLRAALLKRAATLDREQAWIEAVDAPLDTYEYEDES